MGFTADGPKVWPVPPAWGEGVTESLGWPTEVLVASATASSQHTTLDSSPDRSFSIPIAAYDQKRRVVDMLLAGPARTWLLPIYPDVQWLGPAIASGATSVSCDTAGFDFVEGGSALLYAGVNAFEVVTIDTIAGDHIGLEAATTGDYMPGARLYPLRAARLQGGANQTMRGGNAVRVGLTFDICEPCAWPALEGLPEYHSHQVIDRRQHTNDAPSHSYSRLEQSVNYGIGIPVVHDLADFGIRAHKHLYKLIGREQRTWLRSLAYLLQGRSTPVWLPSWNDDLKVVAPIAGGSSVLPVEWAGYTLFGQGRPNRMDLRIELKDGTVFLRRVTAAAEDGSSENLTLSSSLDASSIDPGHIRQVSFMALSTLGSDSLEIRHKHDLNGIAETTLGWQSVLPDD